MHDVGGGRVVVPLLQPIADELPFAVALELHRGGSSCAGASAVGQSPAQQGSYQLHYVLQGQAQLVHDGQNLGEVRAGDSLLMSSGTAQCQTAGGGEAPPGDSTEWHLAVLTLVLGVHQNSDSESDSEAADSSLGTVVDTAVAQQIADEWQAAPVISTLSAETVQRIVASAQQVAQQAVSTSGAQPQKQHIDGTPFDSVLQSSSLGSGQPAAPGISGAEAASSLGAASGRASSGSFAGDVAAAWAAVGGALLRRMPGPLAAALERMQQQRAVRHLEASLASGDSSSQAVQRRRLKDLLAYKLPGQTNRVALLFNPLDDAHLGIPFTFGLEIFERDHKTPPHTHETAHELFFILSGSGTAFCDGQRFSISAGQAVVFPPTSVHGIDTGPDEKLFCLELMLPNEMFAEFVRRGLLQGGLSNEELCTLMAEECGYVRQ